MAPVASAIPEDVLLRRAAKLSLYRSQFERFAEDQLKIITKRAALEPFKLWPFQQRLVERVRAQQAKHGYIRQVWLKSRQIGHSTLAQGLVFHRAVLWPNVNAVVVAHDDGTAQTIFQKAHRYYDHLDRWLKPMKKYSTKQELFFANPGTASREGVLGLNSRIVVASARNIHSGAGGTYHTVHLSEAARYPKPEEIEASTLQTVALSPGTMVIIESTARPEGHWFKSMCEAALAGDSVYEFDFIGWHEDPTCTMPLEADEVIEPVGPDEEALVRDFALSPEQLKWRRKTLAAMRGNLDTFRQEFPMTPDEAWVLRDYTVFPAPHLRVLAKGLQPPAFRATPTLVGGKPLLARSADGPLAVWEEPQTGAEYDIGADVALGVEDADSDYSTAQVLKRPHGVQVAEYRAKIEPGEFSDILNALGRAYNLAQVAVEVNSIGYYTNARLADIYPNLYIWRRRDTVKQRLSTFLGWESTLKSKAKHLVPLAKDRVYRYVSSPEAVDAYPLVRSRALWREMEIYVQAMGAEEYHAAPGTGNHDDLVTAWMIAVLAGHDELGLHLESPEAAPEPALIYGGHAFAMTPDEAAMPAASRSSSWWGDIDGWRTA